MKLEQDGKTLEINGGDKFSVNINQNGLTYTDFVEAKKVGTTKSVPYVDWTVYATTYRTPEGKSPINGPADIYVQKQTFEPLTDPEKGNGFKIINENMLEMYASGFMIGTVTRQ